MPPQPGQLDDLPAELSGALSFLPHRGHWNEIDMRLSETQAAGGFSGAAGLACAGGRSEAIRFLWRSATSCVIVSRVVGRDGSLVPCSPLKLGDGTLVSPLSEKDEAGAGGHEAYGAFRERSRAPILRGVLALALALAGPLSAIWAVPWFVTQDGPAHVYNAQILAESLDAARLPAVYTISWKPIPNWMGHLVLAGLVSRLPPWMADRIMTSATLVGLAVGMLWLRWRVAGTQGLVLAAFLSALLAMNLAWLLGFTSFLIGSCLFPITLGVWWKGRYRLSPGRIAALSALLCVGYFCHLVSLGLTAVGLVVLSAAGPVPCGIRGSWKYRRRG